MDFDKDFDRHFDAILDIVTWWLSAVEDHGRPMKQADIISMFSDKHRLKYPRGIDNDDIKNALAAFVKRGYLRPGDDRPAPPAERNNALETSLRAKYNNLRGAIVVDTTETDSTTIHRQLGHALCADRANNINDGMTIGLGSGRAIHSFTDAFRHFGKIEARGVTVMSLTGTVYPEASNHGQLFDADINTAEFAKFFGHATTMRTVAFPLAHVNVPTVRRNTWLHDRDDERFTEPRSPIAAKVDLSEFDENLFETHVPDIAVVGVGVFNSDHRLWRELNSKAKKSSTMLDPIRRDLTRLIRLSDEIEKRNRAVTSVPYFVCSDVCHRLLYVPPPEPEMVGLNEQSEICDLVDAINRRTLTVTKTQLRRCPNVVLIAGGREKILAIRNLLQRAIPEQRSGQQTPAVFVKTICTDSATARALLE